MENTELQMYDEMKKVATELCKSNLIPSSFKQPQDAWYAILYGRELGLSPIYSLINISVSKGRPTLSADALTALCKNNPQYWGMKTEDGDGYCKVTIKRKFNPNAEPDERTVIFTMEDAAKAGLLGKDNWKSYPKRMLRARATAWACRDMFPDVTAGIYTQDEIDEYDDAPAPVTPPYEVIDNPPEQGNVVLIGKLVKRCHEVMNATEDFSMKDKIAEYANAKDKASLETLLEKMLNPEPQPEVIQEAEIVPEVPADDPEPSPLDKARETVNKGLKALERMSHDGYNIPDRVKHSVKKHLGTDTVEECNDLKALKDYATHLRGKYKAGQYQGVMTVKINALKKELETLPESDDRKTMIDSLSKVATAEDIDFIEQSIKLMRGTTDEVQ